MGCDIHLYTESKRTVNGVEKWVNCDYWKKNPYHGLDNYEKEYDLVSAYSNRNYTLFGILAGVRNGYGNIVISEPKGLPEDVSEEVKKEFDRWGSDGHSHSYFTLEELKDHYALVPPAKISGYVSKDDAKLLDEEGVKPSQWCQSVSHPDNYEFRKWIVDSPLKYLIDVLEKRYCEEFWIWPENYISEHEHKFRVVFWFDN